jgi:curved DNA-binding protein CbpA
MPPRPSIPADDLYARLDVPVDASYEAIEVAWRGLLRRHHPDVAGLDGLEPAKRINVAHDWLSDPDLRRRYDAERHPRRAPRGPAEFAPRPTAPARDVPVRQRPADPDAALVRFLDRVARLTADELDRLDCAEPAPIAFVATVRRFLPPERQSAVVAAEAGVRARLAPATWSRPAAREAVLSHVHEIVLGTFLDELLSEPFRSRVRERLTRGWEAAVGQPRYGPNGAAVAALIGRLANLGANGVDDLADIGARLDPDDPWPAGTSREDDEALRVSSVMAARDAAGVIPTAGLDRQRVVRVRRAAGRLAHLVVLRPVIPAREFDRLLAPWTRLHLVD